MDSQATLVSKKSDLAKPKFAQTSATEIVRGELDQVEALLCEQMQSQYGELQPLLAHGALLGGKRLRPTLVLLAAKATGEIRHDHVVIGAVIEMVHTATLIHDDVLDSADQRRHEPTINSRWGNHSSILLGDYLFARAFTLSATLGSTDACRQIGEASWRVCQGELRQIHSAGSIELTEDDYFDIIRGKTAELCRVGCGLGASHAGADEQVIHALETFGDNLGIAFQIADDYLDLWGAAQRVGKTLGTDLHQAKPTLPIIRLLQSQPDSVAEVTRILRRDPPDRYESLMELLDACDARDYTLQVAKQFAGKAIDSLRNIPESSAKRMLAQIAEFSVIREF